jgi:23S rRNA pseudouridine2605 synthase
LTLHAEKALNKKLWYLRDQGTVATTNPADRQTGLQRPMADQKDQLLQEESPHPVLIKPTVKDQQKNTAANARAKKDLFHHPEASPIKAAVTSPQAVLQEGRQARRNPFHQKAGPIPADQQIMMIGQKEALAANRPGKKDHFRKRAGLIQAGQRIMMKGQKEAKPYSSDRPQRSKPSYDKITPDLDAPVKTLRGRKKGPESKDTGLIRLNRYISNAGICSRRKADELIAAGVVSVNGVVVSELGHKVDPQKDEIKYNGETLRREKMVYVLLNKPKDYITTTEDPQERRTVMHLVEKASKERIYPIGRLDRNTTGLLLMTNDGDLADKLSHPKNNIVKLYQVELNKSLTQGDMNKIGFGLELEDGLIKPDSISYVAGGSKREVGIQIHSGKNRIVRRIFEHLGYEVVKLDRAVYANLTKKDLPRGRWRFLDESEVIQLKHLI